MKSQLLIINPRFPFMFMWWKIGSGHLCCYPCSVWLMGVRFDNFKCVLVDVMVLFSDLSQKKIHLS